VNTLVDCCIRAVLGNGEPVLLSLPGVIAACAEADPELRAVSFPALRAHQAPAFHAFLAQISAMGLRRLGRETLPGADEDVWREVFRELTKVEFPDDEPWCLVTPPDKPALLQPPVAGGDMSGFSDDKSARTPDELDLVVTAKNHDLKSSRLFDSRADDWIFALVSLQTQGGHGGRGYKLTVRLRGSYNARCYAYLAPVNGGFGGALIRSISRLVSPDYDVVPPPVFCNGVGIPLAWTPGWLTGEQLALSDLDPLFVDACRRVRLVHENGSFVGKRATSDVPRVAGLTHRVDRDRNGHLGDPWSPITKEHAPQAFAITSGGLSYRILSRLLFEKDEITRSYLMGATKEERRKAMEVHVQGLATAPESNGNSRGFHSRTIPVPAQAIDWWESQPADAAALAKERIEAAAKAWREALRVAMFVLAQGGREDIKWKDHKTSDALSRAVQARFDGRVDAVFFPALWDAIGKSQNDRERDWALQLRDIAREIFDEAVREFSILGERRFLAEARARSRLEAGFRIAFVQLRRVPDPTTPETESTEAAS
jgi:CRISPR system Cascade subunit CasA